MIPKVEAGTLEGKQGRGASPSAGGLRNKPADQPNGQLVSGGLSWSFVDGITADFACVRFDGLRALDQFIRLPLCVVRRSPSAGSEQ